MKNRRSKFKIKNILKSKFAKFSLIFLSSVALASLVLVGCGNKDKDNKNGGEKIEITFWSHKAENDAAIKKIASDFEKTHSNVKMNIVTIGGSTDYLTSFKAAVSSGKVPDVFNYSSFGEMQDFLPYLKAIEKDEMPFLNDFDKRWFPSATGFDNKLYGLPECVEALALVANIEMFKTAGVDPESLKTWTGLEEGCLKLKNEISNKNSEVMKKFPNLNSVWLLSLPEAWIQGNHGFIPFINMDFYPENTNSIEKKDSPIHKAYKSKELPGKGFPLYKKYIDFIIKYAQDNYCAADYSAIIDSGLLTRSGAITQQGTWIMNKIKEIDKSGTNIGKELAMLPFSTPGGKTDGKYVVYPGQFLGISKNVSGKKYDAIKEFFKYFFTCEDYTKSCDFISPLKNANQTFEGTNNFNATIQKAIKEKNIISGDLSVIRTEDFHKDTLGASIQEYGKKGSDFSDESWNKIVVEPAKKKWTEISERQNKQTKN